MISGIGFSFYVEGDYVRTFEHKPNPEEEDWKYFSMEDIHPGEKDRITIWPPNNEYDPGWPGAEETKKRLQDEALEIAIHVINWMLGEKRWRGVMATLYCITGEEHEKVFGWELL